jgi:hypothetical protein
VSQDFRHIRYVDGFLYQSCGADEEDIVGLFEQPCFISLSHAPLLVCCYKMSADAKASPKQRSSNRACDTKPVEAFVECLSKRLWECLSKQRLERLSKHLLRLVELAGHLS